MVYNNIWNATIHCPSFVQYLNFVMCSRGEPLIVFIVWIFKWLSDRKQQISSFSYWNYSFIWYVLSLKCEYWNYTWCSISYIPLNTKIPFTPALQSAAGNTSKHFMWKKHIFHFVAQWKLKAIENRLNHLFTCLANQIKFHIAIQSYHLGITMPLCCSMSTEHKTHKYSNELFLCSNLF